MSGLNREFGFFQKGLYHRQDVVVRLKPKKRSYKSSTNKLIKQAWEEARLDPKLNLYNGLVLTLVRLDQDDKILRVELGITDFKSFFGTNVRNFQRLDNDQLANAIAVCGAVISTDGAVIMCKRSRGVAEGQELWHVIGGTMELDPLQLEAAVKLIHSDPSADLASSLSPFDRMQTELHEELGLNVEDIESMVCTGLGKNLEIGKPEFLMTVLCNLSSGQILELAAEAPDRCEHTEIVAVPLEDIQDFCYANSIAPIGKACLFATLGALIAKDEWPAASLEELSTRIGI